MQHVTHQVQPSDSGRVDVLVARLLQFSRSRVRGLVGHGGVAINGVVTGDAGAIVAAGDAVQLHFDAQRRYKEKPVARQPRGFALVYSDEHLVVVSKEAGILTVPTDKREEHTLISLVAGHLQPGQRRRDLLHAVHRLDRDTSGLLVFGRSAHVTSALIAQFAERKPERRYVAIVAGRVAQPTGEIRSYLRSDAALNQKSAASGELAITNYTVTRQYSDATEVAVTLTTGRRNQIRVHMAELGHPVLGDQRYQPAQAAHRLWQHKRLALHAETLGFRHPVTQQALRFSSPLPAVFAQFAQAQHAKPSDLTRQRRQSTAGRLERAKLAR